MAVTFDFTTRTANVNGVNKSFTELGIPASVKTEEQAKQYLPDDVTSNFSAKQTANAEGDVLSLSTAVSANEAETTTSTTETTATNAATNTEETTSTASNAKVQAVQAELARLEEKKAANDTKINQTEQKIEALIKKVEEKIDEAVAKQKEITEERKQEAKQIANEEIQKFVQANKNGEGMTKDELSQNITGALAQISEPFAESVTSLMAADGLVVEIEGNVNDLKSLIALGEQLDAQIADKKVELEAAQVEAAAEAKKSKDPIGFTYEDGETYDFIIDDGAFDSTDDFLGSDDCWKAMTALDTEEKGGNGDGIVDANELKNNNIKVVNSKGQVFDIAEKFGSAFSINLNSYKQGGEFAGIDSTKDSDNNGVVDQQLLGTFNLNINGKEFGGYNTLDDVNWLSNKYNFGADKVGTATNPIAKSTDKNGLTLDQHSTKVDNYTAKIQDLKDRIQEEYDNLGIAKEDLAAYYEIITSENVNNTSNPFINKEDDKEVEEKRTCTFPPYEGAEEIKEEEEEKEEELAA